MNLKLIAKSLTIGLLAISTQVGATTVFSDNFNDFSGGSRATQGHTNLTIGAFGSLGAWDSFGVNAVHAVDRSGTGDWAVMLYANYNSNPNQIISKTAFANTAGTQYAVSFQSAGAAYSSDAEGTAPADRIRFDLIRADNSVLYSYIYDATDWTGAASNPFSNGSFTYTGDGLGAVKLSITGMSSSNHFGGAVDNVSVDALDASTAVPEPAMLGLFGMGAIALGVSRRRRAD